MDLLAQSDAESACRRAAAARLRAGNARYEQFTDRCSSGKALQATTDARQYEDDGVTDTPAPGVLPQP
jgi:hypothetical protein